MFTLAFTAFSAQAQSTSPTVDSLASDLAALTARVAKLEGQITTADLVGTYALGGIQMEFDANGGPSAQIASYVYVGTVVLSADGTASLTVPGASGNTLSLGANDSVSPFMGNGGGGGTTTWTFDGATMTVKGGAPPFAVAAGGRIMIGASANNSDGTNVLLILTRLQ